MSRNDASARQFLFGREATHGPVILLAVSALILGLSGCGATTALVKKASPSKLADFLTPATSSSTSPKKKAAAKPAKYPPIPLEKDGPRVRRFIRDYAYKNRETMKRYLARAEEYLPMVRAVAQEHSLPQEVSYLFMLESGANPGARSPANALGMWQFMPATARSYGLRVDSWVDERLDPEKSTRAAMLYLTDLYGMFGCWRLAFSAYNSGENKLNRVLCQEDADEYEEICSSRRLKRETREFWPRFQAIAQIAKNPEKYGFQPVPTDAYLPDQETVTVEASYSLKKLARLSGVSAQELQELNPSLVRGMTPPGKDSYELRIPKGTKYLVARGIERAPSERLRSHIVHVVHKGDNLGRLLRRYRVTKDQLANLNPDVNLRRGLRRGERLVVPASHTRDRKSGSKGPRISYLR